MIFLHLNFCGECCWSGVFLPYSLDMSRTNTLGLVQKAAEFWSSAVILLLRSVNVCGNWQHGEGKHVSKISFSFSQNGQANYNM